MMVALLLLVSGLAEGMMDWLQFRLNVCHPMYKDQFWSPDYSWKNKWNIDPATGRILGEKFFLSSTLFVGFTDGWHLMKLVRNLFMFTGILYIAICDMTVSEAIINVILARIMYGVGFSLSFSWMHKYL